jgi:hypothetical protein
MLTVVGWPTPPVRVITSEGTSFSTSLSKIVCCVARSSDVNTVSEAPVCSIGCSVRVAETTTLSTESERATELDASSAAAAVVVKNDFCMSFSWLVPEAGTRQHGAIS